MLNHQPVASSNLASVAYDYSSCTLEIRFRDGGTYQYFGVPESVYAGLLNAGSKGRYFRAYIKNHYRYRKIG